MDNTNFKVGEEVIALTNPKDELCQHRVKGKTYIVKAIQYCMGCGGQNINIGESINLNFQFISCYCCNTRQPHNGLHWTASRHFIRPKDLKQKLEESLRNEDYETAILLRDINNKIK